MLVAHRGCEFYNNYSALNTNYKSNINCEILPTHPFKNGLDHPNNYLSKECECFVNKSLMSVKRRSVPLFRNHENRAIKSACVQEFIERLMSIEINGHHI